MVVKAGAFRALPIEQNRAMGRLHIEIIRQRVRRCSGRRDGSSVGAGGCGWADGTAAAPSSGLLPRRSKGSDHPSNTVATFIIRGFLALIGLTICLRNDENDTGAYKLYAVLAPAPERGAVRAGAPSIVAR